MFNLMLQRLSGVFFGHAHRPAGAACGNCRHFEDHRDCCDTADGSNGYCCHPWHSERSKSPHWEYGGHWTHDASWCAWHERKEDGETTARADT